MSDSEHKRWTIATVAVLVSWSLTIVGVVWAMSADRTALHEQLRTNAAQVADHETRLRAIEKQTGEIAADVRWIRQNLEKKP